MSRRMKAAILYETNQPLVIEEVTIGHPQAGEVLIKMAASGICHSDVNVVKGDEKQSLPVILGHEAAGYVEEVGAGVTHVKPGDRVAAGLWRSCGHCYYCGTGLPNLCATSHVLDTETRIHDRNGLPIRRGMRVASWAEYAIIDQSQAVLVPDGTVVPIPANRIALTEGRIIGSFLGSTRLNVAFPQLADLYAQGRLKLDELITGIFSLEQINEAITIVEQGEAVRNIIVL